MSRHKRIRHEFVEFIPSVLEQGVLYISIPYATAVHRCLCGCPERVVTPLTPTDWRLTFDGETVSLWPSIGNWGFDCQSHYWVERDQVRWTPRWTRRQMDTGRARDRRAKDRAYGVVRDQDRQSGAGRHSVEQAPLHRWWKRLRERWTGGRSD